MSSFTSVTLRINKFLSLAGASILNPEKDLGAEPQKAVNNCAFLSANSFFYLSSVYNHGRTFMTSINVFCIPSYPEITVFQDVLSSHHINIKIK